MYIPLPHSPFKSRKNHNCMGESKSSVLLYKVITLSLSDNFSVNISPYLE